MAGVLTAMGVIDANATMPVLGDKPASLNLSTCEAWAKRQDADAIEMWGIQEDGVASHDLGIHRLVSECMGDGTPDIVYSQSSADSHEEFCGTHQTIGLCGGKTEPAMPSDYRGAWTENAQGCSKKLSVGDLGPNEYVFKKGRRLNFEGTCKIVRTSKAGLSSWEIDEVCGLNGSSARVKAHWSLSVAGNSMVAVISVRARNRRRHLTSRAASSWIDPAAYVWNGWNAVWQVPLCRSVFHAIPARIGY